jgi:hypothetical protein
VQCNMMDPTAKSSSRAAVAASAAVGALCSPPMLDVLGRAGQSSGRRPVLPAERLPYLHRVGVGIAEEDGGTARLTLSERHASRLRCRDFTRHNSSVMCVRSVVNLRMNATAFRCLFPRPIAVMQKSWRGVSLTCSAASRGSSCSIPTQLTPPQVQAPVPHSSATIVVLLHLHPDGTPAAYPMAMPVLHVWPLEKVTARRTRTQPHPAAVGRIHTRLLTAL